MQLLSRVSHNNGVYGALNITGGSVVWKARYPRHLSIESGSRQQTWSLHRQAPIEVFEGGRQSGAETLRGVVRTSPGPGFSLCDTKDQAVSNCVTIVNPMLKIDAVLKINEIRTFQHFQSIFSSLLFPSLLCTQASLVHMPSPSFLCWGPKSTNRFIIA